jgi:hypothetical protein
MKFQEKSSILKIVNDLLLILSGNIFYSGHKNVQAGSGSGIYRLPGSRSVNEDYGSAEPDPYKISTDP